MYLKIIMSRFRNYKKKTVADNIVKLVTGIPEPEVSYPGSSVSGIQEVGISRLLDVEDRAIAVNPSILPDSKIP